MKHKRILIVAGLFMILPAICMAQYNPDSQDDISKNLSKKSYSPYAGRNFPSNVYWGDTHLHTGLSMDAGAFGNRVGHDPGVPGVHIEGEPSARRSGPGHL